MKSKVIISAFLMILLSARLVQAAGIEFHHVTLDQARKMAGDQGKLIFVDVYAEWCGPCKYLSSSVFPDLKLGEFYNQHFISVKLDGETGEGRQVMRQFSLNAYPSLLYLDAAGNLVHKEVGGMGAESLLQIGKDVLFPDQSELQTARDQFMAGNREPDFLMEYLDLTLETEAGEEEVQPIIEAYLEAKPNLDLGDYDELYVFLLGIYDLSDPLMQTFLADPAPSREVYPDVVSDKFVLNLEHFEAQALAEGSPSVLIAQLDAFYPLITDEMGKEAPAYEDLKATVLNIFEESQQEVED
ncbi:MAG: thioredoxin family protein [Bacteroidia bacterium]|nr:thioredoxin family protein [Bacteroidia bacterium]